jgi:TP901 family phage tail tape measure protein
MPSKFDVVARLQFQVAGLTQLTADLKRQLASQTIPVNVGVSPGAGSALAGVQNALARTRTTAAATAVEVKKTGDFLGDLAAQSGLAARRFGAFSLAAGALIELRQGLRAAAQEAAAFEAALLKIAQITDRSVDSVRGFGKGLQDIAANTGTSASELANVSAKLIQAGFSFTEAATAAEALAKASKGPGFGTLAEGSEALIATLRSFRLEASQSQEVLGSFAAVSSKFAIDARELGAAVKVAGAGFAETGGSLQEFLALVATVKNTTQESAEAIAASLRNVFGRLQHAEVIDNLRELGIELRRTKEEAAGLGQPKLEGQFVGGFEALRRVSTGLQGINPTDPRFQAVSNQLGGERSVNRVLPLLTQQEQIQRALNEAKAGAAKIDLDNAKAQETLAGAAAQTAAEFNKLFAAIAADKGFQDLAHAALSLANSLATVLDFAKPLLPVLAALAATKALTGIGGLIGLGGSPGVVGRFVTGLKGGAGATLNRATGGVVPGVGDTDSVPAMLTPGEFVIRKAAAKAIGYDRLAEMNRYAMGGKVEPSLPVSEPGLPAKAARLPGYASEGAVQPLPLKIGGYLPDNIFGIDEKLHNQYGYAAGGNVYYHGTTDAVLPEGSFRLLPPEQTGTISEKTRKKNRNRVFFTRDEGLANIYAGRAVQELGGQPVVYRAIPAESEVLAHDERPGASVYSAPAAFLEPVHRTLGGPIESFGQKHFAGGGEATPVLKGVRGAARYQEPGSGRLLVSVPRANQLLSDLGTPLLHDQRLELTRQQIEKAVELGKPLVAPRLSIDPSGSPHLLGNVYDVLATKETLERTVFSVPKTQAPKLAERYQGVVLDAAGAPQGLAARLQSDLSFDVAQPAGLLADLVGSQAGRSLLGSLPPESLFLGNGVQAIALATPAGDVARLARLGNPEDAYFGRRPPIEGVLQATSFRSTGNLGYERLAKVRPLDTIPDSELSPSEKTRLRNEVRQKIYRQGFVAYDTHLANIGLDAQGRAVLLDPGFLAPAEHKAGGPVGDRSRRPDGESKHLAIGGYLPQNIFGIDEKLHSQYGYAHGGRIRGREADRERQQFRVGGYLPGRIFGLNEKLHNRHGYALGGNVLSETGRTIAQETAIHAAKEDRARGIQYVRVAVGGMVAAQQTRPGIPLARGGRVGGYLPAHIFGINEKDHSQHGYAVGGFVGTLDPGVRRLQVGGYLPDHLFGINEKAHNQHGYAIGGFVGTLGADVKRYGYGGGVNDQTWDWDQGWTRYAIGGYLPQNIFGIDEKDHNLHGYQMGDKVQGSYARGGRVGGYLPQNIFGINEKSHSRHGYARGGGVGPEPKGPACYAIGGYLPQNIFGVDEKAHNLYGYAKGGTVRHFAFGDSVPGTGNEDKVPALLTPGEFVFSKDAVQRIGLTKLRQMNQTQKFARGGVVRLAGGSQDPVAPDFGYLDEFAHLKDFLAAANAEAKRLGLSLREDAQVLFSGSRNKPTFQGFPDAALQQAAAQGITQVTTVVRQFGDLINNGELARTIQEAARAQKVPLSGATHVVLEQGTQGPSFKGFAPSPVTAVTPKTVVPPSNQPLPAPSLGIDPKNTTLALGAKATSLSREQQEFLAGVYAPQLGGIAKGIAAKNPLARSLGVDEIESVANTALPKALSSYNPSTNPNFEAYLRNGINLALLTATREATARKEVPLSVAEDAAAEARPQSVLDKRQAESFKSQRRTDLDSPEVLAPIVGPRQQLFNDVQARLAAAPRNNEVTKAVNDLRRQAAASPESELGPILNEVLAQRAARGEFVPGQAAAAAQRGPRPGTRTAPQQLGDNALSQAFQTLTGQIQSLTREMANLARAVGRTSSGVDRAAGGRPPRTRAAAPQPGEPNEPGFIGPVLPPTPEQSLAGVIVRQEAQARAEAEKIQADTAGLAAEAHAQQRAATTRVFAHVPQLAETVTVGEPVASPAALRLEENRRRARASQPIPRTPTPATIGVAGEPTTLDVLPTAEERQAAVQKRIFDEAVQDTRRRQQEASRFNQGINRVVAEGAAEALRRTTPAPRFPGRPNAGFDFNAPPAVAQPDLNQPAVTAATRQRQRVLRQSARLANPPQDLGSFAATGGDELALRAEARRRIEGLEGQAGNATVINDIIRQAVGTGRLGEASTARLVAEGRRAFAPTAAQANTPREVAIPALADVPQQGGGPPRPEPTAKTPPAQEALLLARQEAERRRVEANLQAAAARDLENQNFQASFFPRPEKVSPLRQVGRAIAQPFQRLGALNQAFNQTGFGRGLNASLPAVTTGAFLALPFIDRGLEKLGGTAQEAVTGGHETRFNTAQAASGGVTGAVTGALVGSAILPGIGTVVGTIVGAGVGIASSLKDAAEQIRQVKIGNALQEVALGLQTFAKLGRLTPNASLESIQKQQNVLQTETTETNRDKATSLFNVFRPSVLSRFDEEAFNKLQTRNQREQALQEARPLRAGLEKQVQQVAQQNPNQTPQQVLERTLGAPGSFNQQAVTRLAQAGLDGLDTRTKVIADLLKNAATPVVEGERRRQQQLVASQGQENSLNNVTRLIQSLQGAADALTLLQTRSELLAATFEGVTRPVRVTSFTEQVERLGSTRQPTEALQVLRNSLGENFLGRGNEIEGVAQGVEVQNVLARQLPTILQQALASPATGAGSRPLSVVVEGQLNRLSALNSDAGQALKANVVAELNKLSEQPGGEAGARKQVALDPVLEARKLLAATQQQTSTGAVELLKQIQSGANQLVTGLNQFQALEAQLSESRGRLADQRVATAEVVAEQRANLAGKPGQGIQTLSLDFLKSGIQNRLEDLTGLRGPEAFNAQAVDVLLQRVNAQLPAAAARQQEAFQNFGVGSAQFSGAAKALADLQGRSASLAQALKVLADGAYQAAPALKKIASLEGAANSLRGFGEQFLTAGPEEQAKIQEGSRLFEIAFRQGTVRNFTPEQRQLAFNFANAVPNANVFGNPNLPTFQNAKNQLIEEAGFQLPPDQGKELEAARQDLIRAAETQQEALGGLVTNQERLQGQFYANLQQLHQNFLDGLKANLLETRQDRLQSQQAQAAGQLTQLQPAKQFVDLAAASGLRSDAQVKALADNRDKVAKLADLFQQERDLKATEKAVNTNFTLPGTTLTRPGVNNPLARNRSTGEIVQTTQDQLRKQLLDAGVSPDLIDTAAERFGTLANETVDRPFGIRRSRINKIYAEAADLGTPAEQNAYLNAQLQHLAQQAARETFQFRKNQMGEQERFTLNDLGKIPGFNEAGFVQALAANPQGFLQALDAFKATNESASQLTAQFAQLNQQVITLGQAIAALTPQIKAAQEAAGKPLPNPVPPPPVGPAHGGLIRPYGYASGGVAFRPQGTDTVPAMLTPGEFVINRYSAQANKPLLEEINRSQGRTVEFAKGGNVRLLAKGGVVRLAEGGDVPDDEEKLIKDRLRFEAATNPFGTSARFQQTEAIQDFAQRQFQAQIKARDDANARDQAIIERVKTNAILAPEDDDRKKRGIAGFLPEELDTINFAENRLKARAQRERDLTRLGGRQKIFQDQLDNTLAQVTFNQATVGAAVNLQQRQALANDQNVGFFGLGRADLGAQNQIAAQSLQVGQARTEYFQKLQPAYQRAIGLAAAAQTVVIPPDPPGATERYEAKVQTVPSPPPRNAPLAQFIGAAQEAQLRRNDYRQILINHFGNDAEGLKFARRFARQDRRNPLPLARGGEVTDYLASGGTPRRRPTEPTKTPPPAKKETPLAFRSLDDYREADNKEHLLERLRDLPPEERSRGGLITPLHFSRGGRVPGQGSADSVPALLTPGEVVLPRHFATGGPVGNAVTEAAPGVGLAPEVQQAFTGFAASTAAFGTHIGGFTSAVGLLGEHLNLLTPFVGAANGLADAIKAMPTKITLEAQQTVQLNLNGGELLTRIMPEVGSMIETAVKDQLRQVFTKQLPDAGVTIE